MALSLPAGIVRLRLRSRRFIPSEMDPARPDGRELGAMLAVLLDGAPPPDTAFAFGWHGWEGPWRWTDGDAALILDLPRPAELTVREAAVGARYWLTPEPEPASKPAISAPAPKEETVARRHRE